MERKEFITPGDSEPVARLGDAVALQVFANSELGAESLTTCAATIDSGGGIPYHTHPTGEAITLLRGDAVACVEGREYRLRPFDCVFVPAGVAHAVRNDSTSPAVLHTAFPTGEVDREFVEDEFETRPLDNADPAYPENLARFEEVEEFLLDESVRVRNLFSGNMGADGVCGGHGAFPPGTELPCHTHVFDESITIVAGRAICEVAGARYELSDHDTICIPRGRPHRFLNAADAEMAMIWVYAGDEPMRDIVEQRLCDGS